MPNEWTSCKFNQRMFDEFLISNEPDLVIIVTGGSHPPGIYTIPREKALEVFMAKSQLPCWTNFITGTKRPKNEWSSKSIPLDLNIYFRHE